MAYVIVATFSVSLATNFDRVLRAQPPDRPPRYDHLRLGVAERRASMPPAAVAVAPSPPKMP